MTYIGNIPQVTLDSPNLTGTPTASTAPVGTNNTQIATTEFVNAEIANDAPTKTGEGASGTWNISVIGNAGTATKLATARNIALTGDVTGSVDFDGSANVSITATVADNSHNHTIANVSGLQSALDNKLDINAKAADSDKLDGLDSTAFILASKIGIANGVASLGSDGKVPASQLPSFVDDVLEYSSISDFPTTGESSKIYVALDTNKTYRWSGSAYIYITSGAVDSVAGKTGVVTLTKADVGLDNVDNTSDLDKPISTATQNALDLKAPLASPAFTGTPTAPTAAIGTSTTQIATTEFVNAEIANDAPTKTGEGASGTWNINITGNAATATKLAIAKTIALTGDVTGSVTFDGSTDISITTTVADNSHNHTIDNISELQNVLDSKAPLTSPTFIGGKIEIVNASGKKVSLVVPDTLTEDKNIDLGKTYISIYRTTNTHDIFGDGSCIATYQLDGNANDLGGNYNGSPTNISYSDGVFGQAGVFNGSNSQITANINALPVGASPRSMSVWVKCNENSKMSCFVHYGTNSTDKAFFLTKHPNKIVLGAHTDDIEYSYNILIGAWIHLCGCYDGSMLKLYVNGTLVGTRQTTSVNTTGQTFKIGAGITENFNGQIDQVRIFNRALTDDEVQILYSEAI